MSETEFKLILEQVCAANYSVPADVLEHRFSHRHNRRMKRIFKLYEKNTSKMHADNRPKIQRPQKLTLKYAVMLAALIFLAALAGCTVAYFTSQDFRGEVHKEYTRIFPTNTENCPATIEEKYYLPELPEEFEVYETEQTSLNVYISYRDYSTRETIVFRQIVKPDFPTMHLNTEQCDFQEVDINGHCALLLDYNSIGKKYSGVIWDNGDYVIELCGNLSKNQIIDLAKSTKIYEN